MKPPMPDASTPRPRREPSRFGRLLRFWRDRRGWSQLELALAGGGTQRHVSFLESGRSHPSREMVLRLAAVLDLTLRERNRLMEAGGYAATYPQRTLDAPELAPVREALAFMLRAMEPYPAFVVDRLWTVLQANAATQRLLGRFVTPEVAGACLGSAGGPNLLRLMLHPHGLRPRLLNWSEVVGDVLLRLQREAAEHEPDAETEALLREARAALGTRLPLSDARDEPAPVLGVIFQEGDLRLNLFSTISTLGTAQDVTLQELRIETLFPADADSERALRALAGNAQ